MRDYNSTIEAARIQGIEQGIEKGERIGKIQLLQQLLDEQPGPESELIGLSIADLSDRVQILQSRLAERGL